MLSQSVCRKCIAYKPTPIGMDGWYCAVCELPSRPLATVVHKKPKDKPVKLCPYALEHLMSESVNEPSHMP